MQSQDDFENDLDNEEALGNSVLKLTNSSKKSTIKFNESAQIEPGEVVTLAAGSSREEVQKRN